MIKVSYTELDGPHGPTLRLEAAGHASYAPAGQDIVCAGASTLMQALVSLLAGEENASSDVWEEPGGPRLAVTAAAPQQPWVEGAFELAKAGFALLAERYPDNLRFADLSRRGEAAMMDLQLFSAAEAAAAPSSAPPALSAAQEQQAVASGTMKPEERAEVRLAQAAPPEAPEPEQPPRQEEQAPEDKPQPPRLPPQFPGRVAVDRLHSRWAGEEAMIRRAVPGFSLQQELRDPEMRRLMQLPGMRVADAYRLAHYNDALRQTAQAVEQGVVERIRQRAARPAENGTHPGSAAVTGADVSRMTRAQREALERQAMHGARISF